MALFKPVDPKDTVTYQTLDSGYFWKMVVPQGEWRDVILEKNPAEDIVVLCNADTVSPRVPALRPGNIWTETYGIFGQSVGITMLEAKQKGSNPDPNTWSVVTYIQVEVVAGPAKASAGTVTASYQSQPPSINGGDYRWQTQFILKNATGDTNGFIVQKVTITFDDATQGKTTRVTYWEAWRVMHGRVFSGNSKTRLSLGDEFTSSGKAGSKGVHMHQGELKFFADLTDPEQWSTGSVKEAGSLPAVTVEPGFWKNGPAKKRQIKVEFDGTVSPPTSNPSVMDNFD